MNDEALKVDAGTTLAPSRDELAGVGTEGCSGAAVVGIMSAGAVAGAFEPGETVSAQAPLPDWMRRVARTGAISHGSEPQGSISVAAAGVVALLAPPCALATSEAKSISPLVGNKPPLVNSPA